MIELFKFDGRVGRRRFVLTQLVLFTTTYFSAFLFIVASGAGDEHMTGVTPPIMAVVSCSFALFVIALAWISLATTVKRCHDRNLSGWMLLFAFPPILGQIWLVMNLLGGPSLTPTALVTPGRLSQSPALA
jgi:uncharacterized membrane protein YhaH (DUF805 family)